MYLNTILLMGNLGDDPEVRSVQGGGRIATFSLVTTNQWKKGGEQKKTTWHTVVVKDDRKVPMVERYLKKGDRVLVRGEFDSRKFTDKDGYERTVWEVVIGFHGELVLLGDRSEAGQSPDENPPDSDPPA